MRVGDRICRYRIRHVKHTVTKYATKLATFVQRILRIVLSTGLVNLCVFCNLPQGAGQPSAISTAVLQVCAEVSVFESLNNHMFDSTCLSNHMFSLIKCCSLFYTKIRMYHLGE